MTKTKLQMISQKQPLLKTTKFYTRNDFWLLTSQTFKGNFIDIKLIKTVLLNQKVNYTISGQIACV